MTKAIQVEGLRKKYPSGPEALRGVDFEVESGDFFALLGPNGAGKSTLIGILSSLVVKSSGRVTVNGYDLDKESLMVKSCLGLVPQEFNLNIFETVTNILVNQAGYYGVPKITALQRSEKYLKLLGLWKQRNDQIRSLSGGMKRRVMIVRALIHEPPILILDEPTAGVDVELRKFIWTFLEDLNKKEKKTIILTTHYLEEVERLCRNVAIINSGKLVSKGSLEELIDELPDQSYVLTLKEPLESGKMEELKKLPYKFLLKEEITLEASLLKGHSISEIFRDLESAKVEVHSIRMKENLIESAFFHVTKRGV